MLIAEQMKVPMDPMEEDKQTERDTAPILSIVSFGSHWIFVVAPPLLQINNKPPCHYSSLRNSCLCLSYY